MEPRCNGVILCSEFFHRAKIFRCVVVVGHLQMIRHTGRHRLRFLLVAPNHLVMLSQSSQNLGHLIPVVLTVGSGTCYSLTKGLGGTTAALDFGTVSHAPEPSKIRCTFCSAPYTSDSHRCVSGQPAAVPEWGPWDVQTSNLPPKRGGDDPPLPPPAVLLATEGPEAPPPQG